MSSWEFGSQLNKQLFDEMPLGIGITDEAGALYYHNAMMLRYSGFSEADITQVKSIVELYYEPIDRMRMFEEFKKKGFVENFETRFRKKDGGFFYALLSLRPFKFEHRQYFLASILDITELKKSREDLEKKNKELETLNKAMIGRELAMVELKKKLKENSVSRN